MRNNGIEKMTGFVTRHFWSFFEISKVSKWSVLRLDRKLALIWMFLECYERRIVQRFFQHVSPCAVAAGASMYVSTPRFGLHNPARKCLLARCQLAGAWPPTKKSQASSHWCCSTSSGADYRDQPCGPGGYGFGNFAPSQCRELNTSHVVHGKRSYNVFACSERASQTPQRVALRRYSSILETIRTD